jgi:hypothetical protein
MNFSVLFLVILFFYQEVVFSSQSGPVFPSHRFPTDKSFHISYQFMNLSTSSNYLGGSSFESLNKDATFSLIQNQIIPEFQPDRSLSFGAILSIASGKIKDKDGTTDSKTQFGDQRIWAEYRFVDGSGYSIGSAFVPKFAFYKNPKSSEIKTGQTVLMGDSQVDLTWLVTTEFWPSRFFRLRGDIGYNYRTDDYGSEIPFLISAGFANPRIDLDFKIRGNTNSTSVTSSTADIQKLRTAFRNSDYALSQNPSHLILNPTAELWVSSNIAMLGNFSYSISGAQSARFHEFGIGLIFRESETKRRPKTSFKEVDLSTDQESGQFPGEIQEEEFNAN